MFISKLKRYTTSLSYSDCRHFSGNSEPTSISLREKEEACGFSIIVISLGRNRLGLGIRASSETRGQLVGTERRNNWQNRKLRDQIVNSLFSRFCPWFLRPVPSRLTAPGSRRMGWRRRTWNPELSSSSPALSNGEMFFVNFVVLDSTPWLRLKIVNRAASCLLGFSSCKF